MRTGNVPLREALALITQTKNRLKELVEGCQFNANLLAINEFLLRAHRRAWNRE